jgi:hypothetical protein
MERMGDISIINHDREQATYYFNKAIEGWKHPYTINEAEENLQRIFKKLNSF